MEAENLHPFPDDTHTSSLVRPTLLIMAAGMGSRYGGLKQLDSFGPNGETIMQYSVYDAIRAGFGKVVFVIRQSFDEAFRKVLPKGIVDKIQVEIVHQELDHLPAGFLVPADRVKPWGTGHAVWVARQAIKEPFAVINGDDFYGAESFKIVADFLKTTTKEYCLAGYRLANTLSEFGTVARGICGVSGNGYLESVTEITSIQKDGTMITYAGEAGQSLSLTGDETVSMNLMGFIPSFFEHCDHYLQQFLDEQGSNPKAEFLLPRLVNTLVQNQSILVKVLRTPATWFGVTYAEDKPSVVKKIAELTHQGIYPKKLWE